jgi:hypothetical protein
MRFMSEPSQYPPVTHRSAAAASVVATTARWLGVEDDFALGCECADPSLQIERWGQEVVALPSNSS